MKSKKVFILGASVLSMIASVSTTGCTGTADGPEIDKTKTTLRVKYTNGGFGSEWLDVLIEEFTEKFANTSFEAGKTGVQVIPEYDKRNVGYTDIRGNVNHIFIQEDTDYSTYLSKGVLKDITDVVEDYAVVDGSSKETDRTIEDKIPDTYKTFFKYSDKYYGIPLFETNVGLQYNVGVFEKYGLFFKKGATAENFSESDFSDSEKIYGLLIEGDDDEKSYGPDGQTGVIGGVDYTIDDGLPATYKDLRALIEAMKYNGVTPFIWNSTCTSYLTGLINDAWATNEGAEQFNLNFTFEGKATNLVKMTYDEKGNATGIVKDNGEVVTESLTINGDNYSELQRQKGKLQALDLCSLLLGTDTKNKNYYADSWITSYVDAQDYFINPTKHQKIGEIGFIVEGGWWFREATDRFDPGTQATAKFSPYILPKATAEQIGTPNVRVSDRRSLMFISNYCEGASLEVAKTFLSFLQSDHALETYTKYTHCTRALDYDLSEETYNSLSYYGKCAWNVAKKSNTITLPWLPLTSTTREHVTELDYTSYGFALDAGEGNPVIAFNDAMKKGSPKTSESYFVEIYNFKKK